MPRIPTITRNVIQAPTVNVSAASAPYQAQVQVGQAVANLGNTVGNIYADIQTKRRETADLVNLATAQNSLEDFKSELAESLGNETDFNNISEDTIDAKINTFRDTYSKMFEDSPNAALKFDNILSSASRELKKVAYARHDTLLSDQAKVNTEKYLERETLNYVNATDPEQQKEILNNVNIYVNGMADSNAYSKTYAYDRAKKFQNDADKIIEENKKNSAELLETAKAQAEKEAKEANQKAHDDEEREIGNLFMQGNYTEVYNRVLKSERLTGDEKKTWSEAIKSGLKTGDGDISDDEQAAEIVKINDMIAQGKEAKSLRAYVIATPYLKKEDKEQLINKIETKYSKDVETGRSLAYGDIKDMIIPKRNTLTSVITSTTLENKAVQNAEMALDEWIDTQQKNGKYPTLNEVRKKGQELAQQYQVPIAEGVKAYYEESKQQAEALKGL